MNEGRCCIKLCCFNIVLAIVAALFTFGLGLVLGTAFATTLIEYIASIIVFVVVMFVIFLILYILRMCRRDRDDCFGR